jgi:hypothetical protein
MKSMAITALPEDGPRIASPIDTHASSHSNAHSNVESAERSAYDLEEQDGAEGLAKYLSISGLGLEKVDGRLKSYDAKWRLSNDSIVEFPISKQGAPTPEVLSKVGFYYCPDKTHMDR